MFIQKKETIKKKEKVYCMKHEYDFIRELLSSDKNLFDKYIGIYWSKKFNNYMFNYNRIDESFRDEFLEVFSSEFKQGFENNEIDLNLFSKSTKRIVKKIVNNPKKFRKETIHNLSFAEEIFSIKRQDNIKYLTIFGHSFAL